MKKLILFLFLLNLSISSNQVYVDKEVHPDIVAVFVNGEPAEVSFVDKSDEMYNVLEQCYRKMPEKDIYFDPIFFNEKFFPEYFYSKSNKKINLDDTDWSIVKTVRSSKVEYFTTDKSIFLFFTTFLTFPFQKKHSLNFVKSIPDSFTKVIGTDVYHNGSDEQEGVVFTLRYHINNILLQQLGCPFILSVLPGRKESYFGISCKSAYLFFLGASQAYYFLDLFSYFKKFSFIDNKQKISFYSSVSLVFLPLLSTCYSFKSENRLKNIFYTSFFEAAILNFYYISNRK